MKRVQDWLKGKGPTPEVPARKVLERWGRSPDVALIRSLVISTFPRLPDNRRNQLLGYLLWNYTWLKGVEIAEIIGRTPGAVSQIARRVEARLTTDPELESGLKALALKLEETAGAGAASPAIHPDDWLRREALAEPSMTRAGCHRPGVTVVPPRTAALKN